jgi:hypothetical protein
MKKFVTILILLINISAGHALAAYDPEYGDAYSTLPTMSVLNPLEGSLMITSEFSLIGRVHPVFGNVRPHKGTDLGASMGDNIYASLAGTVTYSGWAEGYGNVVYILSKVGGYKVETRYAHCSALLVSANTQVAAGTIIAKVGDTGWATGPHLHFEIRINGEPVNPRRYLKGLPPSSGVGYGELPDSLKNIFDAAYDFGKPLREVIEKFGEQCQNALTNLIGIEKLLLIIMITIDLALSASLYVADSENGAEFFSMITTRLLLYVLLIYFLLNWGDSVANFAKEMFTGFGGLMMGASGKEAMEAVSNPMDIISKGVHIIAPIYNELFKIHGVYDLMTKVALWLPSLIFAVILTICFFAIAIQITLAYLEFYITMVTSYATFFLSGLKQTRKYAAKGINAIFAVSIKLMFFCMFSLMMQMMMKNIVVEDFYTIGGETSKIEIETSGAITSIDQLMAHIREVESSNRYYVDNGLGYFGAYQIDYANYDNWSHWTADYVANGGVLEKSPVTAEEPHSPAWTPNNQDNIARYILTGYYEKYGSYEMAARCWNQGEGGRLNSEADIYWAKVSGVNPTTGGYTAPQVTINMILLFKITLVAMMFVYMGSRITKLTIKQFGNGGFKFTSEGA